MGRRGSTRRLRGVMNKPAACGVLMAWLRQSRAAMSMAISSFVLAGDIAPKRGSPCHILPLTLEALQSRRRQD